MRYVTTCSTTDIVDGWREHRRDGGAVIDVEADRITNLRTMTSGA